MSTKPIKQYATLTDENGVEALSVATGGLVTTSGNVSAQATYSAVGHSSSLVLNDTYTGLQAATDAVNTRAFFGVSDTTNGWIQGSAAGDAVITAKNKRILFSGDDGATIHGICSAGAWTMGPDTTSGTACTHVVRGGVTSGIKIDTSSGATQFLRFNIQGSADAVIKYRTGGTGKFIIRGGSEDDAAGTDFAIADQNGAWTLGSGNTVNHQIYAMGTSYGSPGVKVIGASVDFIGLGVYSATARQWDLCSIISGTPNYFALREAVSGVAPLVAKVDGTCWQGNNSASWSTTSDIRIKQNVRDISLGLEKINSLHPVHFEYITNPGKTKTGFIAQEFESVLPGHVSESSPTEEILKVKPELEGETIKGIDADLMPYLVKAIQELSAKVDSLQAELNTLKGQ